MELKKITSILAATILFSSFSTFFSQNAYSKNTQLVSFNAIRNNSITNKESEIGIINFNEFLRIHFYNYLSSKSEKKKNNEIVKLNAEIRSLKTSYKSPYNHDKKPPIIMHWTAGNTAMGAIRTLFKSRPYMDEGFIGVDYVVTEPLKHPDYPKRPSKSYAVKLSGGEVATTWFEVPDKYMGKMSYQHKKYNNAINIEIVGWRFLQSDKGRKNDFGQYGKLGIRETFDGNFDRFDNFSTYPTVIKLVNYLSEKNNFSHLIDNFNPNEEINNEIKEKKNLVYLDGPLSNYIKGHGLIALEHTLLFGSRYDEMRSDFTPKELLVFYSDLKKYREHINYSYLANQIEEDINKSSKLTALDITLLKSRINKIKNNSKKEFLLYTLYFKNAEIRNVGKFNEARRYIDSLEGNDREKLFSLILHKYLLESHDINTKDYKYLKDVILTLDNSNERNKLIKVLEHRFVYENDFKSKS